MFTKKLKIRRKIRVNYYGRVIRYCSKHIYYSLILYLIYITLVYILLYVVYRKKERSAIILGANIYTSFVANALSTGKTSSGSNQKNNVLICMPDTSVPYYPVNNDIPENEIPLTGISMFKCHLSAGVILPIMDEDLLRVSKHTGLSLDRLIIAKEKVLQHFTIPMISKNGEKTLIFNTSRLINWTNMDICQGNIKIGYDATKKNHIVSTNMGFFWTKTLISCYPEPLLPNDIIVGTEHRVYKYEFPRGAAPPSGIDVELPPGRYSEEKSTSLDIKSHTKLYNNDIKNGNNILQFVYPNGIAISQFGDVGTISMTYPMYKVINNNIISLNNGNDVSFDMISSKLDMTLLPDKKTCLSYALTKPRPWIKNHQYIIHPFHLPPTSDGLLLVMIVTTALMS